MENKVIGGQGSKASCWIGTSNIVLPGNRASFPEAFRNKSRLQYYSTLFNSIEINSSFYKIPCPSTVAKWANETPADFRFTFKLFQAFTHVKNLAADVSIIERFMEAIEQVGSKRGCILVQLPGKIDLSYFNNLERMLTALRLKARDWHIALECRNTGLYQGELIELLNDLDATLVLHDYFKGSNQNISTNASYRYVRFHGPSGDYRSGYSLDVINNYAKMINNWLSTEKMVYAYFNNSLGNAFHDAECLTNSII